MENWEKKQCSIFHGSASAGNQKWKVVTDFLRYMYCRLVLIWQIMHINLTNYANWDIREDHSTLSILPLLEPWKWWNITISLTFGTAHIYSPVLFLLTWSHGLLKNHNVTVTIVNVKMNSSWNALSLSLIIYNCSFFSLK